MNPGIDDATLMSRVRLGDREAFGQLVDRHKDGLVNYLTGLTRSRDRAEELAQESFLRLYQSSARYREQGQFVPFLFRIATNLLRSEERRARRFRILSMKFSSNGHDPRPTPQAELVAKRPSFGRTMPSPRCRKPSFRPTLAGLATACLSANDRALLYGAP